MTASTGLDQPAASAPMEEGGPSTERDRVRRRLQAQRKFRGDLVAYAVINAFLIVVWLLTDRGYFWPGWVMAGWGVLLVLKGWDVFLRRQITDADVEEELRRRRT